MKLLWARLGRILYWFFWPAIWLLVRHSRRTRVMVIKGEQILLLRNWLGDGAWVLPGGGRHRQETAEAAAARELHEETGLTVRPDQLLSLGQHQFQEHGLGFEYELFEVALPEELPLRHQPIEVLEVQWWKRDELAQLKLGGDVLTAVDYWLG